MLGAACAAALGAPKLGNSSSDLVSSALPAGGSRTGCLPAALEPAGVGVCVRDGSVEIGREGAAEGIGCLHIAFMSAIAWLGIWVSMWEDVRRILILDFFDVSLVLGRSGVGGVVLALQTLGGGLDGRAGGGVGSVSGRHVC